MRHLHYPTRILAMALVLGATVCRVPVARAACTDQSPEPSNDLSLECLVNNRDNQPSPPPGSAIPTPEENANYRSLVSELAGVLALPMAGPADTVGYSGFHFSFDSHLTSISQGASYWSGPSAGVRRVTGPMLPVLSIMLRKGVWMPIPPLPSVELGLGASNLAHSSLFALNGYFKLAIHEGYHDVWVPSIALRAGVTRLVGAAQLDMTILTADGVISKAFGAGGTVTLEPYLGGGAFFTIVRSQVIDVEPTVDLYRGPVGRMMPFDENARRDALAQKIVFDNQSDIIRWRVFAGLHFHYAILAMTVGFTYLGPGLASGGLSPANALTNVQDLAGGQYQINLSGGVRF
ncbi:MAG: hypothetical protein NZ890_20360 [Myxococcota bacterium]|nr:hypothetical protein [Myxococcota bacterium]